MERQFDFLMPSVNFFGPGVISKIGDRAKMLNMNKVLVVTGSHIRKIKNDPGFTGKGRRRIRGL